MTPTTPRLKAPVTSETYAMPPHHGVGSNDGGRTTDFRTALAKVAKILNMPVVLTSWQEEMFQGPLLPELADIVPDAFAARIKRTGIVNAWDDKNFVTAVKKTRRKNLVMAGVTTDICLVFPAISAVRAGYRVQAVMDASGSPFELSGDIGPRGMGGGGGVFAGAHNINDEDGSLVEATGGC